MDFDDLIDENLFRTIPETVRFGGGGAIPNVPLYGCQFIHPHSNDIRLPYGQQVKFTRSLNDGLRIQGSEILHPLILSTEREYGQLPFAIVQGSPDHEAMLWTMRERTPPKVGQMIGPTLTYMGRGWSVRLGTTGDILQPVEDTFAFDNSLKVITDQPNVPHGRKIHSITHVKPFFDRRMEMREFGYTVEEASHADGRDRHLALHGAYMNEDHWVDGDLTLGKHKTCDLRIVRGGQKSTQSKRKTITFTLRGNSIGRLPT